MVLVGGWVPELLIKDPQKAHIGSLDVDIALNHLTLLETGYHSILSLLQTHGYRAGQQPFIFFREVNIRDRIIEVEVDFLAGEYAGTSRGHRTQIVQDLRPRKARGCDLALTMAEEIQMSGTLPNGASDSTTIRVASIVPFIVMKGMAMASRMMEKDAWDIYFCIRYFPGGIDQLVEEFREHLGNKLVQEALGIISQKFETINHLGPVQVADFEDLQTREEREFIMRDVFERVNYLLMELKIRK